MLNNQHQSRIDEFAARCATDPSARVLFQPYTTKHLREVRRLADDGSLPVALYLVEGRHGTAVTAKGSLEAVEYLEDLSAWDRELVAPLRAKPDDSLYATNLFHASGVHRLREAIPLATFRKRNGGTPLASGSWPAVVCLAPEGVEQPSPTERAGGMDESVSALEGTPRLRMLWHRSREQGLRRAKVERVLAKTGSLACEVPGCGFDYRATYGAMGEGYAQVHHLEPLGARERASATPLDKLAIVCANCHAIIHRGGGCRSLEEIAAAIAASRSG